MIGRNSLLKPLGSTLALPDAREGGSEIVLRHCPIERRVLARIFLKCLVVRRNGLLESLGPALTFPDARESDSEIILYRGPFAGCMITRALLQRLVICRDSLFELRGFTFPLAQGKERATACGLQIGAKKRIYDLFTFDQCLEFDSDLL